MFESNRDLAIATQEFLADLRQTLDKFAVLAREQAELREIVQSTYADIVNVA